MTMTRSFWYSCPSPLERKDKSLDWASWLRISRSLRSVRYERFGFLRPLPFAFPLPFLLGAARGGLDAAAPDLLAAVDWTREREPDDAKRAELLTFVVIGGGPTGV